MLLPVMSVTLQSCRAVILVKAMPNPSQKYGETVCCAGVTAEGRWKRLYPVRFRLLESKFNRWDWVSFKYRKPTGDDRAESCHVFEDKLKVIGKLKDYDERALLLNPLISPSTADAAARGLSLTLLRPSGAHFFFRKKRKKIEAERQGYKRAARQTSLLDEELDALEPTPYTFAFSFEDAAGKHVNRCSDWETSATFWKWKKSQGEAAALKHLSEVYNEKYPSKGMVFAMGTIKARPKQWLLLGIIRLNELTECQKRQPSFAF
jgi:hypothetical protein